MERRTFLKATGAAGVGAALANVAQAAEGTHQSEGSVEDEYLVTVSNGEDLDAVAEDLPDELEVLDRDYDLRYIHVRKKAEASVLSTLQLESQVSQMPGVRNIEENAWFVPMATEPNDPLYSKQYHVQQTRANNAWDETFGSEDVTIAVIDQGADYEHPDLKDQYGKNKGKDFVDDDDDPMPPDKTKEHHATHVSGIASATTNNGTGVAGQSNSKLLSCRALGTKGGSIKDIADAIKWATDQGADLINMSLGGGGRTDTGKNAVSYAMNNGVLPFASAGNAGSDQVGYPARYDECVAVSAIDEGENLASFSNTGPNVEITGPGVDVLSCWPVVPKNDPYGGKYNKISGTSMSCPAVTGVAALGLAANPDLSPSELRQKLKETAVDVGLSEEEQGAGRADAVRLVGGVGVGEPDAGPTAEISADPTDPHVGEKVFVLGNQSTDPDGYVDEWEWDFGDGTTMTGERQVHAYENPGDYTIELTVTDEDGQTSTTSQDVTVQAGACGTDPANTESYSGTIKQSETRDTKNYTFQTDEPCKLQLDLSGNSKLTLYVSQRSTKFLKVESSDQVVLRPRDIRKMDTSSSFTIGIFSGRSDSDPTGDWSVSLEEYGFDDGGSKNQPPEASFTPDSPTVAPGKAISFDASGSSDPDGTIASYEWEFGDGKTASGQTVTHAYGSAGSYDVALTVTDDGGKKATATTTVTVESPNEKPTASFSVSDDSVDAGTEVQFDATDSTDPDGSIAAYRWAFDDGSSATGATVAHTFDSKGTYQVELTVEDDAGATDTATKTVDVSAGDTGGKCGDATETTTDNGSLSGSSDATAYTYSTELDDPCEVDLSLSGASGTDYDLYVTLDGRTPTPSDYDERSWNYGSDESITISGDNVTPDSKYGILVDSYTGSGDFTLTIEELGTGAGGSDPKPPKNEAPTAAFTASATEVKPGQKLSFDAGDSSDADGSIDSFEWDFGDGSTASGEMVSHAFSAAGTYTVSLTVTDDDGATASASKKVTVSEADPVCGSTTKNESASGSLSSSWDDSAFSYTPETSNPCQITVTLSGPSGADFDLYATTDGRTPSTYDYDKRSTTPDANEQVVFDDVSSSDEIGILVDAWSGSGSFDLSVEELGK